MSLLLGAFGDGVPRLLYGSKIEVVWFCSIWSAVMALELVKLPRVQIRASFVELWIVTLLKLFISIDDVELVVPVAVPFEKIEQSVPKLFICEMLTPCSLFGVKAMMHASDELQVVVFVALVWTATARARMVKLLFAWPNQLRTTPDRKSTRL